MNKKGEIVITTIYVLCALVGLWFGGTKIAKAVGVGAGQDTKTTSSVVTESTIQPIKYVGEDGKTHIMYAEVGKTTTITGLDVVHMSFFERVKLLGIWWIILTIVGWFFAPVGYIMTFFNNNAKKLLEKAHTELECKHDKLEGAKKNIVNSVEAALKRLEITNPEVVKIIKDELSKAQDTNTKTLVNDLKHS